MPATAFKQISDNAFSSTATNLSAAGITSIILSAGTGSQFPQPGNGYWLTLWDNANYPNSPGADPHMEKVACSARSIDTLTISATTKTHTNPCAVGLLDVAQNTVDLQTAVNSLEAGSGSYPYEKTANKGIANGYPGLDGSGKVPASALPATGITGIIAFDANGVGWQIGVTINGNLTTTSSGTTGYPNTYQVTYS